MTGCPFGDSFAHAALSMLFAGSAFGAVDIDHAASALSKQSGTGERHALPAGMPNPVISVGRRRFGRAAWKSPRTRLGGASDCMR